MIDNFDDFCLWMYVMVDDLWRQIAPWFHRPGPKPDCSDSELLTMALVGECRGWDLETEMLSYWGEHRDLFPRQPSQSRFNRRRRALQHAVNLIRQIVLSQFPAAEDRQCIIDSLPVPVVAFQHAPCASRQWVMHEASFGRVASKKQTIFGYKLHLLMTIQGVILDFVLVPAHIHDLAVAEDLLSRYVDLLVIGDKGYISAQIAQELWDRWGIRLLTLPRTNQKQTLPPSLGRLINRVRQIVETVNGQLTEQFHIEINHAHTVEGLISRLLTKLTAHTLCLYLNYLLGKADFLQIKALAFPI